VFFVTNGLLLGADTTIGWMFFNSLRQSSQCHRRRHIYGHDGAFDEPLAVAITLEIGHAPGTLTGGDVESTRKAKEDRPTEEKRK